VRELAPTVARRLGPPAAEELETALRELTDQWT
jgi:hypothetical protein